MARIFFCLMMCLFGIISGFSEEAKSTVCLNMIVKNETKVIERCLQSVLPIIDTWVIVDTGSTDGTQELIRKTLQGIPGELYERPWVNFGHNREEALKLAQNKADYVLFIDADEKLVFDPGFQKTHLDRDYYFIQFSDTDDHLLFSKVALINMQRDWKWLGVIHEELKSNTASTSGVLDKIRCVRSTSSSARSQDPEKYRKDARLLEAALKEEPNNSRYYFYLAQSYANAKEYPLALKNYEKRSTMGGWDQEVFWSLLMVAKLQQDLKYPVETVMNSYSKAYQYRPTRAEPLFYLSRYCLINGNPVLSYALAKLALPLSYPKDDGYIESFVYEYGSKQMLARAADQLQKYEEASSLYRQVLEEKKLPEVVKATVEQSLADCLGKMRRQL